MLPLTSIIFLAVSCAILTFGLMKAFLIKEYPNGVTTKYTREVNRTAIFMSIISLCTPPIGLLAAVAMSDCAAHGLMFKNPEN